MTNFKKIVFCFLFAMLTTSTLVFSQSSTLSLDSSLDNNGLLSGRLVSKDAIDVSELVPLSEVNNAEVFFTDPEKKLYYIDFQATKSKVVLLQLWKNQEELIKNETTQELPENTIYELKISDLPSGSYSIELTTIEDDVIIQIFNINDKKEETVEKNEK